MMFTMCYPGTIPDLMQGACLPCPAGNSCADPRHGAIPCAPGTYSLEGNHTTCIVCPEGYSCADPSLIPLACNLGELLKIYCIAGSTLVEPVQFCQNALKSSNFSAVLR